MMRSLKAFVVVVMVAAACSVADDVSESTTTDGPDDPTTTTTTIPPEEAWCAPDRSIGERYDVDLDGEGLEERVFLVQTEAATGSSTYRLGVCAADELVAGLSVDGTDLGILGFVDLDDDGTREILMQGRSDRGSLVQAAALTLRGLVLTDIAIERWIEAGFADPPEGPFHAGGLECADVDDDGELELLSLSMLPADDLLDGAGDGLVHVSVAVVGLDGTASVLYGVDAFETDFTHAYARWSDANRCAPGSPPRVEVRFAPNGWGWVEFDPADFASDGDVVLTSVARGGTYDRYVAVGTELPSLLIGEFFPQRPAIWSSTDALAWERADLGGAAGELRDVVALGDGSGFVAVGRTSGLTAAVWLSADGRSWELVEVPAARSMPGLVGPVMSQIATTPFGLVAVGFEDYLPDDGGRSFDLDGAVWVSADGRSWERIEDTAFGTPGYQPNTAGEFNSELVGVAYHEDIGIVVVGSASDSDPSIDYPTQNPAVWLSPDGQNWQRHVIDSDARLRGVATGETGVVVFGVSDVHGSPDSDAVVLYSTDGVKWVAASGDFAGIGVADGIQSINHALEIPGMGIVAVGSDEEDFETIGGAAAWWSDGTDLSQWRREAHDDGVFTLLDESPTATMTGAVWSDGQLVTVGFTGRPTDPAYGAQGCCIISPAIWIWNAS